MSTFINHQLETVAAIDLGSNSFHMIVARLEKSGTLSVIDRLRENVRLGGGLDDKGLIDTAALKRAFECLETFAQRINHLPDSCVRIAGTNTLRVAKNAEYFTNEAEKILNHPIEIIAGREEARLIYLGVAHGLATGDGKRLVVDIGGGSTEIIIGHEMHSLRRESLYTGCVSSSKRFFENGVINEELMQAAELDAKLKLFPQSDGFNNKHWEEAIGCAGTIKAIANIVQQQGWCLDGINKEALKKLRKQLIKAGNINKLDLPGLSENRKPVIPGGLSILLAVFKTLKIENMRVSHNSLREGLLYDLVGRITEQDVRDASVESAMGKWGVDVKQAKRVADTAELLFDLSSQHWKIDNDQMKPLLKWAAMLHEIGLQVSHNNYHKHGAYLLSNADLQGFSQQEQALLAALVLSHRSKFRVDAFNNLMKPFVKAGKQLCVLLRIAVLLHRGRAKQSSPKVELSINNKDLKLQFPQTWLDNHNMTLADLINEIDYLDAAGYQLSFE